MIVNLFPAYVCIKTSQPNLENPGVVEEKSNGKKKLRTHHRQGDSQKRKFPSPAPANFARVPLSGGRRRALFGVRWQKKDADVSDTEHFAAVQPLNRNEKQETKQMLSSCPASFRRI